MFRAASPKLKNWLSTDPGFRSPDSENKRKTKHVGLLLEMSLDEGAIPSASTICSLNSATLSKDKGCGGFYRNRTVTERYVYDKGELVLI